MPVVSEMVHPLGLDFQQQRKVILLRDTQQLAWHKIALRVKNRQGMRPSKQMVINIYRGFKAGKARRPYKYHRCGRKPYKLTSEAEKFLVKKLLQMRRKTICTSTTLQRELAAGLGIHVAAVQIRRALRKKGYRWIP